MLEKPNMTVEQFRPLIVLCTDLSRITTECGKYPSCWWPINFTYDYTALLFGVSVFPLVGLTSLFDMTLLERELCKAVMRKACRASDVWREKMTVEMTELTSSGKKWKL